MADELLVSLLFDEKKIVTALTLSRHADIPIDEAVIVLSTYFDANKGKNGLWAVYSLSGKMSRNGIVMDALILSKPDDLEEKRASFVSLPSEHIYSLQTVEIEDLYSICASDMLDDGKFFRSDASRAGIVSKVVVENRLEMEKKFGDQNSLLDEIVKTIQPPVHEDKRPMGRSGTILEKKQDLKKMFEKACARPKEITPKNTPKKAERPSPFSSTEKIKKEEIEHDSEEGASRSPELNIAKRRTRKIIIDDEDSCSPKTKQPKKEIEEDAEAEEEEKSATDKKSKQDDKKKSKTATRKLVVDAGDIFDATASSPEKEPEPIEKPKKTKAKKVKEEQSSQPTRRSPRKHTESKDEDEKDAAPVRRKVMKKVTESYVDEDGFLVNKEVLREVSVGPEEDVKPLRPAKAENQEAVPVVKGGKKTAASTVGQSKISSFFNKK